MKKDQVYSFKIDHPLTEERRKAIEREIDRNATTTDEPVSHQWDEHDTDQLHIDIGPVKLDVLFYETFVEVYVDAPLWARVMITKEKEASLRDLVQSILVDAHLIETVD